MAEFDTFCILNCALCIIFKIITLPAQGFIAFGLAKYNQLF